MTRQMKFISLDTGREVTLEELNQIVVETIGDGSTIQLVGTANDLALHLTSTWGQEGAMSFITGIAVGQRVAAVVEAGEYVDGASSAKFARPSTGNDAAGIIATRPSAARRSRSRCC